MPSAPRRRRPSTPTSSKPRRRGSASRSTSSAGGGGGPGGRGVRGQAGDDPVERELAQVAVEAAVESTRLMHRILAQGEPAGEEARKTELEGPFGGDSGSTVTASMRALTNGSPKQEHPESEPSRDGAPETPKRGRG